MQTPDKILVVEDEAITRMVVVQLLQHAGYRVLEAEDGATALRMIEEEVPALTIMDVNMPEMGGFAALETLRTRGMALPVLMLSAQGEIDQRVKGLGLGADDYMGKPFDPRELLARVAALLRRGRDTKAMPKVLRHGGLVIDFTAKRAERSGEAIALTATEFAILELLTQEAGRPVSRERMLDAVWGYNSIPNTRTVETHIWRLRKKLGDSGEESGLIQNRHGLGYVLVLEADVSASASAMGAAPAA